MTNRPTRSIYDFPDIYDRVLRSPPGQIETEVDSVRELLASRGIMGGRLLEIACGACAHGIPLSAAGFQVVALDGSANMLEAAGAAAARAGVDVELHRSDIVDFDLKGPPFDAAIFMSETFPLITERRDIERHFRAVGRHLRAGAPYVIDVDSSRHGFVNEVEEWGRIKHDLGDRSVEIWYEDLPGDWVEGTSHLVLHCRIESAGEMIETRDEWRLRRYSPWALRLLAETLDGWSLDGFFSWRDLSPNIRDEEHYFTVFSRT